MTTTTVAEDFERIISALPQINTGRQYWFVRTEGGLLFDPFMAENLIAIDYHRITIAEIETLAGLEPKQKIDKISKLIRRQYEDVSMPGLAASNIVKFIFEMKRGDIVIIPSPSSQLLAFGVIQEDKATQGIYTEIKDLTGFKVRKVKWVKTVSRDKLNPKLYRLFFSHQAVVSGNEYADYIDATINDFYIKDQKIHLQLKIDKEDEILAKELFTACLGLLEVTDDFLRANNIQETTSSVEVKVSVNSPGVVEFIGCSFLALTALGFCIVALAGGGIEGKILGQEVSFKTDGLLIKISEFLRDHQKRKLLTTLTSQLDMKNPDDAVKLIGKLLE